MSTVRPAFQPNYIYQAASYTAAIANSDRSGRCSSWRAIL
jgi:hypothetical protein